MGHNRREFRFYVVNVQTICIDSGWADMAEATARAVDVTKESGAPAKVMTKPRIGFGATETRLDPNDDASWVPKRRANPSRRRNPGAPGGVEVGSLWVKKATDRHARVYKVVSNDGRVVVCEDVIDGSAFRVSLVTFNNVFTQQHTEMWSGRTGNVRENPEPDSARAEKIFQLWHKKEPRSVGVKKPGVNANAPMVCVGNAHDIVYSSGKWKTGNKKEDFIHVFDSKPKVWMLASLVSEEEARGSEKSVEEMLGRCCNNDGQLDVADLARPVSFSLNGGDEDIVIHAGAKVYGAHDQKTVIIFDPKWKLVVIRGGEMHFDERGIVK